MKGSFTVKNMLLYKFSQHLCNILSIGDFDLNFKILIKFLNFRPSKQ